MSNDKKITVVDYGIGNVFSVCQAVRQLGGEPVLTANPEQILAADRLVLPGVGSFRQGMLRLVHKGLADVIREYCRLERPFLGICLGMQLLMDSSSELGHHEGLGIISGTVDRLESTGKDGRPHKIPHIAWAPLLIPDGHADDAWDGTILAGIVPQRQTIYFVHSYAVRPADIAHTLAEAEYDGRRFTAVVRKGSIMGTQFHPERSGAAGLRILRNFMES